MKRALILLFLVILFAGCQKKMLELGDADTPADSPEYTEKAERFPS